MSVELNFSEYQSPSTSYVFTRCRKGHFLRIYAIDVPASFLDHNGDRCYADAPLAGRLYHWVHGEVRHSYTFLSSPAHYGQCFFSANESFRNSDLTFVRAKWGRTTQIPVDQVDVTAHMASEPHPARQMDDDDSCTSVDEQAHKKQNGLGLGDDLERGV